MSVDGAFANLSGLTKLKLLARDYLNGVKRACCIMLEKPWHAMPALQELIIWGPVLDTENLYRFCHPVTY